MQHLKDYIKEYIVESINNRGYSNFYPTADEFCNAIDNEPVVNKLFKSNNKEEIKMFVTDLYNTAQEVSKLDKPEFNFGNVPLIFHSNGHIKLKRFYEGTPVEDVYKNNRKLLAHKYIIGNGSGEGANKGEAFETYFIENFNEFEDKIKEITNNYNQYKYKNLVDEPEHVGGANTKRPLTFENDSITCGKINNDFNIGKAVSDVTLHTDGKNDIYLSLKSGPTVTFVNAGIQKIIPNTFYSGKSEPTDEANQLFSMFNIDINRYRNVFKNYEDGKRGKDEIVEADLSNKLIINFIKSVIGYGFILVHQKGKDMHFIDLLSEDKLMEFLSLDNNNTIPIKIRYPGNAKEVNINIDLPNIEFNFRFRNKGGGLYPSHLTADYKIVNH